MITFMFSVHSDSVTSREQACWRFVERGGPKGCDGWRGFMDSGMRMENCSKMHPGVKELGQEMAVRDERFETDI